MALAPGSRFGPYEVVGMLGAGGMGQVYRARDPRLGRDVAIKILPPEVAGDPDRLARFEREAQVLASLNHPNIGALYGLEESAGFRGLVLELVEGANLAERLTRGALPLGEALSVAQQIADGLEAAHERGIVHRDLKPANVQCAPDGTVKLLDFGLAKATEPAPTGSDPSFSPTLSAHMTQAGMILGTAAYMSPEQARGKPVDARVDVWAFGCVLFEMLAGAPAFGGETVTDILGAIVHKEPDWERLPATTPRHVRRVLRRCLAKELKQRFHAVGDVRIALTDLDEAQLPAASIGPAATGPSRGAWLIGLAATLGLGLLAGWMLRTTSGPDPSRTRRYSLTVEALPPDSHSVALAPDGSRLIYPGGDPSMLRVRDLDRFESTPVAGTEGAQSVILSPDGRSVVFVAGTQIRRVDLDGGPPVTLHDFVPNAVKASGGAWASDGTLYLGLWLGNDYSVLYTMPANGGAPRVLIERDWPDGKPTERFNPRLVPGERALAYTVVPGQAFMRARDSAIHLRDLKTGEDRLLMESAALVDVLPSGHLLASRGVDEVTVTPIDLSTLQLAGPSVPLPRVIGADRGIYPTLDATPDGMVVFDPAGIESSGADLVWLGLDGGRRVIESDIRGLQNAALAPDGKAIALVVQDPGGLQGLQIFDLEREALTTLTSGDDTIFGPTWSPDSKYVYYLRDRRGEDPGLYRAPVDRSSAPQRVAEPRTIWLHPCSVSPDGKFVANQRWDPDSEKDWDIWITSTDSSTEPQDFLAEDAHEVWPRFSPDGRWLAFGSDRNGSDQVYLKRFPESGGLYQVSQDGAAYAMWAHDGTALFFVDASRSRLYRTDVDLALDPPRISKPRLVVEIPPELRNDNWWSHNSLDTDDARLVTIQGKGGTRVRLDVIENWFPELARLAPVPR